METIAVWIIPLAKYILATLALLVFYRLLFKKNATYKASRHFLLSMSILAVALSQFEVKVPVPDRVLAHIPSTLKTNEAQPGPMAVAPVHAAPTTTFPGNTAQIKPAIPAVQKPHLLTLIFNQITVNQWLLLLYLSVCAFLLLNLIIQYLKIRRLKHTGLRSKWNGVNLVVHPKVSSPFSSGKTVFLPANMHEPQKEVIIQHEYWHIQHKHYLDVFVQEACTCIFWFNPFFWSIRKELRNLHEFQADRSVLNQGCDLFRYQTIILQEVMGNHFRLANGFNQSFTKKRFIQMKNNEPKRTSVFGKLLLLPYLFVLFGLFCVTPGSGQNNTTPNKTASIVTKNIPAVTKNIKMEFNANDLDKNQINKFLDSMSMQADVMIPILGKLEKEGLSGQSKAFDQFLGALNMKVNNQALTKNDIPKELLDEIKPEDFGQMKTYMTEIQKSAKTLKNDQTLSEEEKTVQATALMQKFINLGLVQKVMPMMMQMATKALETTMSSLVDGNMNKMFKTGRVEKIMPVESSVVEEPEPVPVFINPYCKLSGELYEWSDEPLGEIKLVSIERNKMETVVTLSIPVYENQWVQFSSGFVIKNQKNGDRYKIRRVENLPLNTEIFFHDVSNRMLQAKLIFPPLKSNATVVDIIEDLKDGTTGWKFEDVRVSEYKPNARGEVGRGKTYK